MKMAKTEKIKEQQKSFPKEENELKMKTLCFEKGTYYFWGLSCILYAHY